jgi:protein-S-isoprenylcysteine O-methyltransferase Ste14
MRINIMHYIIFLSVVFGFSEFGLLLVKHSKVKAVKTRIDKGSMILIWLMITFGFICGFYHAKYNYWNLYNCFTSVIGLIIVIAGIIIRWVAIIQLGSSFTVDVAINFTSNLKTDGIYKKVRHPSYSGLLMVILGFACTMNNVYSFLVLVIPVLLAILYRIRVEEQLLRNEFGDSYSRYSSNTKKLIPGIY